MDGIFRTITGEHWAEAIKMARSTPNLVAEQIHMKLNPANPTPGVPAPTSTPKEPITNAEIVEALIATLVAVQLIANHTFLPNAMKTAWDKVNNLRIRCDL